MRFFPPLSAAATLVRVRRLAVPRGSVRRLVAAVLLLLVATGPFAPGASAVGQERQINVSRDGVSPQLITVAKGDTLIFANNDDSFAYEPRSTSDNWSFDAGPAGLEPKSRYQVPNFSFEESGTYTFDVFSQDKSFAGKAVLPKPATAPAASPKATRPAASNAPAASAAPAASNAPATPSPSASAGGGGTGTAGPPITRGFTGLFVPGSPPPAGGAQAPDVAPAPGLLSLPGVDPATVPTLASAAPLPSASTSVVAGGSGRGPDAAAPRSSGRAIGLPALVGLVLAVGVVSLLVRVLLAEGRRRPTRQVVTSD